MALRRMDGIAFKIERAVWLACNSPAGRCARGVAILAAVACATFAFWAGIAFALHPSRLHAGLLGYSLSAAGLLTLLALAINSQVDD